MDYEALQIFLKEYGVCDVAIHYDYICHQESTLECSIPLRSIMRLITDLGFATKVDKDEISYLNMMGFDEKEKNTPSEAAQS